MPGVRAIAGVLLLYLAGALVGSRLTLTPEGVALLWPSNAVLLSALLRWEGRRWWAVAAVGLVAEVIADVPFFPLRESLVFGSVNANLDHYAAAADALAEADLDWLGRLVSRRVPLERFQDAFTPDEDDVKVVITLD